MHKKILMILFFVFWAFPALAEMIVDTAWVRRYNGPGDGIDRAEAIAVDSCGNVYVTGSSGTIKYDSGGNQLWIGSWGGVDIALDTSGNAYVTGGSYDYVTIRYYPNGDTAWVRRYNGPGGSTDVANAIAIDDSSNVYVTGWSYGSDTGLGYATIKYYPNGDIGWVGRYNGPGNEYDCAYAIAVDGSGNVYVTGYSAGVGTWPDYYDYATIKYDSSGNEVWVRRYNGQGNSDDLAYALALDGSGNVYVTGASRGDSATSLDYATIKYYPDGDTAWVRRYSGPGDSADIAYAVAVDGSGNVYVTGEIGSVLAWWLGDYATIRYDQDGNRHWVRRYNGPGDDYDCPSAIAVDGSGNAYVTGRSYGNWTSFDYATLKYDTSGNEIWVRRYNGPGNSDDEAYTIAVDDYDNVYVTGESYGSGTFGDYATIKYFQALRGDVNRDGVIDIADVVYLINYLFVDGPAPVPCLDVGDANCDGVVDISDVVYPINYLFAGGPPPDC